jgi:hypothetical protein
VPSNKLAAPILLLMALLGITVTARHTGAQSVPCGSASCIYLPVLIGQSAFSPVPTKTSLTTATGTVTSTPGGTATGTVTSTPGGTATSTATNTPTTMPGGTATNTATSTATNTPTNTPTSTATSTATNTPTSTPTATPTNSIYANADMQVSVVWNRPGDFDLVVCTPSGKKIWKNNRGPNAGTDFHVMDRDDSSGTGPENIYGPTGTGLTGIYQIAGETPQFGSLPSAGNPVVATFRIVVFGGTPNVQIHTLTTTYTSMSSFPGERIATLNYPAGTVSIASGPLEGCS